MAQEFPNRQESRPQPIISTRAFVVFFFFGLRHLQGERETQIMAPTEQSILTNYLLAPAQLPTIMSLQEFTALFPRKLQSSPRIRSLYRDLQSQRNAVVDHVAAEIEQEAKRGKEMRRAVIRSKRAAEAQEQDAEIEIERMVSSNSCSGLALTWICTRLLISYWPPCSWETGQSRKMQSMTWPPSSPTWRAQSARWRPSFSS